jgi:lysozyme
VSAALDIFTARAPIEEGVRYYAYDDATGKTVTCKPGNLSIGIGINLEQGLDSTEVAWLFLHRARLVEGRLLTCFWYVGSDPVRQSVALDLGFNMGFEELLQFKNMIAAWTAKNWPLASAQLLASKAARENQTRYEHLASILMSGSEQVTT